MLTALVVAGCSPGYPTEDVASNESMTAQDHVESLNELSADVARHVRHRVELVGDCLLRFVYDKPRQGRDELSIPLLSLQSTSRTDAQTRLIAVAVSSRGSSESPRNVYETRRWHETVAFQSHLSQLSRLCAESLESPEMRQGPDGATADLPA